MTAHDCLVAGRKEIEAPRHWTKGTYAKDVSGWPVDVTSEEACSFCVAGALMRGCPTPSVGREDAFIALYRAMKRVGGHGIVSYNDASDTTHDMVLAVFDDAIEATS